MIIILNLFAYLTIRLRPKLFDVKLFKPMIWNFKLSIMPVFIIFASLLLFITTSYIHSLGGPKIFNILSLFIGVIGSLAWLLVLPNSGYLITELNLSHREEDEKEVPLWYDIVSVTSFALSGIVNTVLNINIIQYIYLIVKDPDTISLAYKYIFFTSGLVINILVSIGVYLGRYIRFNSWDVLKPISFIKKIIKHFSIQGEFRNFLLFVFFHSVFFYIVFLLLNVDNLILRA